MSSSLSNHAQKESIIQSLSSHLWAIQKAIVAGTISVEILKKLARASNADLLDPPFSLSPSITILLNALKNDRPIQDVSPQIMEEFCRFDVAQGDYLNLPALASFNDEETLRTNLNDLALLYLHFGQFLSAGEDGNFISFDEKAALGDWQTWKATRPSRSIVHNDLSPNCLLDKFLVGSLGPEEWLTDRDIAQAIQKFGGEDLNVPIVMFNVNNLGIRLHFDREAHCSAEEVYTLPLILNLDRNNHRRLDGEGQHWVYMVVTVNPNDKSIMVKYRDSIQLNATEKNEIAKTLEAAFNYTETIGNSLLGNAKHYMAYPGYRLTLDITSSNTQKDGYSCGYRAVQGLILDLKIGNPELSAAETSQELRNLFYRTLISEHAFTESEKEKMDGVLDDLLIERSESFFIHPGFVFASLEISHVETQPKKEASRKWMSNERIETLKEIAKAQDQLKQVLNTPSLKAIATHHESTLAVDFKQLLEHEELKEYPKPVVIQAVFNALSQNQYIKVLHLVSGDNKEIILENLDRIILPEIAIEDADKNFSQEIACINWRNQQLADKKITADPWVTVFHTLFLTPPSKPVPAELNSQFGMKKLGEFFKSHQALLETMPSFLSLDLRAIDGELALEFIRTHKESIPAKEIHLNLNAADLLNNNFIDFFDLDKSRMEWLTIHLSNKNPEKIAHYLKVLQTNINENKSFTKRLNFNLSSLLNPNEEIVQTIIEIQNTIEGRHRLDAPMSSISPTLQGGIIHDAIFGENQQLDIAIDQQQEQQQQQQQQMQSEVAEEDIDEERGANQEKFHFLAIDELLINRRNIDAELGEFIQQQGIFLKPEECWDRIVGIYADKFQYGIKKLTRAAAEKLILNLAECRYGLMLDNLPCGFSFHENFEGELFLSYDPADTTGTASETPLTLSFNKPMEPEIWLGDMSQFLSIDQQQVLYNDLYSPAGASPLPVFRKKSNIPTFLECQRDFFGLLNPATERETKLKVIAAILGDEYKEIELLFENTLTDANIMALAQMIYRGKKGLRIEFFQKLAQLKSKDATCFEHFKEYFLDPSQNWGELGTRESIDAIAKITQFNRTQLCWWQGLTTQHSAGLKNATQGGSSWISLTVCMNSFCYFQEKLDEICPGIKLLEYFPFSGVAHMQLGLDRLLVIMEKATDKQEQWAILQDIALNGLGPFYASRYEGFTYVSAAMALQYDDKGGGLKLQEDCAFRLSKTGIQKSLRTELTSAMDLYKFQYILLDANDFSNISIQDQWIYWKQEGHDLYFKFKDRKGGIISGKLYLQNNKPINQRQLSAHIGALVASIIKQQPALSESTSPAFLRYAATFNARFNYDTYQRLFHTIIELKNVCGQKNIGNYEPILAALMTVILEIGTGKACRNFDLGKLKELLMTPLEEAIHSDAMDINIAKFQLLYEAFSLWVKQGSLDLTKIKTVMDRLFLEEQKSNDQQEPSNEDFIMVPPNMGLELYTLINFISPNCPENEKQKCLDLLVKYAKNRHSANFMLLGSVLESLRPDYNALRLIASMKNLEYKRTEENEKLLWTLVIKAICSLDSSDLQEGSNDDLKNQMSEKYRGIVERLDALLLDYPHHTQTLIVLMDKWASIDVENSGRLPSVEALNNLLDDIKNLFKQNNSLDLRLLHGVLRKHLDANIQFDKATIESVSYQAQGSLSSVLATQMGAIIAEIEKAITNLPPFFQKEARKGIATFFGEGYSKLRSADGANILISLLGELKLQSGDADNLIKKQVRETVQVVMTQVYDDLIAAQSISISPGISQLFTTRLDNPLKLLNNYDAFADCYSLSLSCVNNSLLSLAQIKRKWPKQFDGIEKILLAHPAITQLNIFEFERFMQVCAHNLVAKQDFPIEVLIAILEQVEKSENKKQTLEDNCIFLENLPKEDSAYHFTTDELLALLPPRKLSQEMLISFGKLKEKMPSALSKILSFNIDDMENYRQFIQEIESLMNKLTPALVEGLISLADGAEFVRAFLALEEPVDKELLQNLLQQAQRNENDKEHLFPILESVSSEMAVKIKTLYALPPYPSLEKLRSALEKSDPILAIHDLLLEYDSDPHSHRKNNPNLIHQQFSTEKFASLIDGVENLEGMKDLLAGRVLLLNERQELYDWLIYVNEVGRTPVILVQGEAKAVKDMTRDEILHLMAVTKKVLAEDILPEKRLRLKLEFIALMREAMYRATSTATHPGSFAYPTQLLYLLSAIQKGDHFVAEIPTGQGKSLTAALAAGLTQLENYTVDICTSSAHLAAEGLKENKAFFDYLGIHSTVIRAGSKREDYVTGGVHYTSLSDRALFHLKHRGSHLPFPEKIAAMIDEVDFFTLDDNLNYRLAQYLDKIITSHENPYRWIYEKAIEFVDAQKEEGVHLDCAGYLKKFKQYLDNAQINKEKRAQLEALLDGPAEVVNRRLTLWLVAAAKTAYLQHQEEHKFRVLRVEKKLAQETRWVSKACILVNGQPKPEAEFSEATQQFLHLRLLQQKLYAEAIQKGDMPEFLVEPEKHCVAELNSMLVLKTLYSRLWGMTGTSGSPAELDEQSKKYGLSFIQIPPYHLSARQYLPAILTDCHVDEKGHIDKKAEEQQYIELIVQEVLAHRAAFGNKAVNPILIHCSDKTIGEKIANALTANGVVVNQHYGDPDTEIDSRYKNEAGRDGVVTISNVFSRGTDIKPTHPDGLYCISTCVDTHPHSVEDLTRSLKQVFGRAARQNQKGTVRLILRRSEFLPIFMENGKGLKGLKALQSKEVDSAIVKLNAIRSRSRKIERDQREQFSKLKHLFFQEFLRIYSDLGNKATGEDPFMLKWSEFLAELEKEKPKEGLDTWIENQGFRCWNQFLEKLQAIATELNYNLPQETFVNRLTKTSLLKSMAVSPNMPHRGYVSKAQYDPEKFVPLREKDPMVICCNMDSECSPKKKKKAVDDALEKIFRKLALLASGSQSLTREHLVEYGMLIRQQNEFKEVQYAKTPIHLQIGHWLRFLLERKMQGYLDDKDTEQYSRLLGEITDLLCFINDDEYNGMWNSVNLVHYIQWTTEYEIRTDELKRCSERLERNATWTDVEKRKELSRCQNKALSYMRSFMRLTPNNALTWNFECVDMEIGIFKDKLLSSQGHDHIIKELKGSIEEAHALRSEREKIQAIYNAIYIARKMLLHDYRSRSLGTMKAFDMDPFNKLLTEAQRRFMCIGSGVADEIAEKMWLLDVGQMFLEYQERGVFKGLGAEQEKILGDELNSLWENEADVVEQYKNLIRFCAKVQACLGNASEHKDENLRSLYYYTWNTRMDLMFSCDMNNAALKKLSDSITCQLYAMAPLQQWPTFFMQCAPKSALQSFKEKRPSFVNISQSFMGGRHKKDKTTEESSHSFLEYNEKEVKLLIVSDNNFKKIPISPEIYMDLLKDLEKYIVELRASYDLQVSFERVNVFFTENNSEHIVIALTINQIPLGLKLKIDRDKKTVLMDDALLKNEMLDLDFSPKKASGLDQSRISSVALSAESLGKILSEQSAVPSVSTSASLPPPSSLAQTSTAPLLRTERSRRRARPQGGFFEPLRNDNSGDPVDIPKSSTPMPKQGGSPP